MKSSTTKSDHSKHWSKKRVRHSSASKTDSEKRKSIDIEASLLAQRQLHQNRLEDVPQRPVAARALPGYAYDSAADRYYRVPTSRSVTMVNTSLKFPPSHVEETRTTCRSILNLLNRRQMLYGRCIRYGCSSMQSEMTAGSLLLKPVCFDCSDSSGPDYLDDNDLDYHPTFGVARTSAQLITVYESQNQRYKTINMSSFTRLRGSSHPHWRPSTSGVSAEKPTLALLVHSDTFVQTMLLQQQSESTDYSRRQSGLYPSIWKACKIGGLSSIDQGSVSKIEWSSSGEELFQLCETGIWMTNVERNFFPVHSAAARGLHEMSYSKSSMVLSTRDSNRNCNVVAMCNSIHQESVKYVGFRNGELKTIDIRCPTANMKIGQLPYCIDHIDCLRDETTLVAQDITGQVSLYDCRMPMGRKFTEYLRVVEGKCAEVRKTRRFWIDPGEGFIVIPANSSSVDLKNNSGKQGQAFLAAYTLKHSPVDYSERQVGGIMTNLLSLISVNVPVNRKSITGSQEPLTAVSSTVKLPTSRSAAMASWDDRDEACAGLYCVANIQGAQRGESVGEGSALFKATSFDNELES